MLKKSHLLLPLTLILALVAGCSSTDKEKVPDEPPEKLFQQAQEKLDNSDYTKAIELLEALDSRYPFGAYSAQVQLDLIYAYYKDSDTAHAIANIDRFLAEKYINTGRLPCAQLLVARNGQLLTPDRRIWPDDALLVRKVASSG